MKKKCTNINCIYYTIEKIKNETLDPIKNKPHRWYGKGNQIECHVDNHYDWIIVYEIFDNTLCLIRTGAHSDLGC